MTKSLLKTRFDIYALGTRQSPTRLMSEELSFWSNLDETVIGTVILDYQDNDYGWVIMCRDKIGRFRCTMMDTSITSKKRAEALLRIGISKTDPESIGRQGDEPNAPFDVMSISDNIDKSNLHPYFIELSERPAKEPARKVIREIAPWLTPSDPHFVQEFQQHQFDQRLWELYVWATFRELGFDIEQKEAPDFTCIAPGIEFSIEATTTAPSVNGPLANHPNPQTQEEMKDFIQNYMPMKFGSSLLSKLNKEHHGKKYWELEHTTGKPFVIAIADFHKPADKAEPGSMVYSQPALPIYLYGNRFEWEFVGKNLVVKPVQVKDHKFGEKVIPSGFFDLPEAKNISAVIFSNAGTIAKFDRMGVIAGFGKENHKYIRMGFRYDPDPNAVVGTPFSEDVSDPEYEEYWSDEIQIFHNPNASIPLPEDWFGDVQQHSFKDGNLYSYVPHKAVISSHTLILHVGDESNEDS